MKRDPFTKFVMTLATALVATAICTAAARFNSHDVRIAVVESQFADVKAQLKAIQIKLDTLLERKEKNNE